MLYDLLRLYGDGASPVKDEAKGVPLLRT